MEIDAGISLTKFMLYSAACKIEEGVCTLQFDNNGGMASDFFVVASKDSLD